MTWNWHKRNAYSISSRNSVNSNALCPILLTGCNQLPVLTSKTTPASSPHFIEIWLQNCRPELHSSIPVSLFPPAIFRSDWRKMKMTYLPAFHFIRDIQYVCQCRYQKRYESYPVTLLSNGPSMIYRMWSDVWKNGKNRDPSTAQKRVFLSLSIPVCVIVVLGFLS